MATLSLVLGVLSVVTCCVPVVGPVLGLTGAGLAVGAILAIGEAQGRLGGKGLAAAGLITSALGMVLGGLIAAGMVWGLGQIKQYGTVMSAVESGDVAAVSPLLAQSTPQPLTAERLASFRDRYRAALGAYRRVEGGLRVFEAGGAAGRLGPGFSTGAARPIPLMGVFEKGEAPILFLTAPMPASPALPAGPVENVVIVPAGGQPIWLFEPSASGTTGGGP